MAQLRTKQIKDFNAEVQALIDNDADQNAGLIDALEASVDSLEAVAGGSVTSDLAASVDSLEVVASTAIDERGYLDNSVDSLETRVSTVEDDLSTTDTTLNDFATRTDASIDSLELIDSALSGEINTEKGRIDAILNGADVNLDQFTEVVAYVNSLDVLQGGELTNGLTAVNASIDSLEVVDGQQNASIDSLEAVDTTLIASIDSLELATGGNTSALEASVDSLEVALGDEITATGGEVTALQASVDSLELIDAALSSELSGNATYVKQGGVAVSPTEFRVAQGVRFSASDDLSVFINGLEIHPRNIEIAQPDSEYGGTTVSTTEGYSTVDGTNFTLNNLGYSIDTNDHIHVIGIVA